MRTECSHGRVARVRTAQRLAAFLVVACAAPAHAQGVNTSQLYRVLTGETIREASREDADFTREFFLDERRFSSIGSNLFFSLDPGHRLHLAGEEDGSHRDLFITVLRETRFITLIIDDRPQRIRTRVVEEREYVDGVLSEVSRNYYARDIDTDDIFYFGEDVCFYDEQGNCVGTDGSWLAGVDGAEPGIIMPGSFILGARYLQENAPGVAVDRAEHVAQGLTVSVPAGEFKDCVMIFEDTALDPGAAGEKVYCPEVGFVKQGALQLVAYSPAPGRR